MHHQIVSVSKHVSVYRGFTIQTLPRSIACKNKRYQITKDGMYYGQEFASAEAVQTIDKLHTAQEKWCELLGAHIAKSDVTGCTDVEEPQFIE